MKRKYQEVVFILLLLFLYSSIFLAPNIIMESGSAALLIFKDKLFPSIFPFFILSFLMLHLGIADDLSHLLNPFMRKLFHLEESAGFVLLMSIISGFPSGPKYIAKLYQEKKLTKKTSNYLLFFTHFANPLFILGTCGILLHNTPLAFKIFLCQLLANGLVGFLMRPKTLPPITNQKKSPVLRESFLSALPNAINEAMEVLLFMLGSIAFFMFLSKTILTFCPMSSFLGTIITGILDLTSGITKAATLALPNKSLAMLMLTFITFGSFSVHIQVLNALKKTDLAYKNFFLGRFFQTAIALVLFRLI